MRARSGQGSIGLVICTLLLMAACGGGDGPPAATAPPLPSAIVGATQAPPSEVPPTQARTSATPSASPTVAPSVPASPAASPTLAPNDPFSLLPGNVRPAVRAAAQRLDALARPLTPACSENNPQKKPCVWLSSSPGSAGPEIIQIAEAFPDGGGVALFYAQDQAGTWDLWFASQQTSYHLLSFPGDMIVCADGQGANVRTGPTTGAQVVTLIKDIEKVRADSFILTQAADAKFQGGQGWYRLTAPVSGWIRADFVSDAKLGNCDARNQTLGAR